MGGEGKQACISCYFESGGTYTPVNSVHSLDNAIKRVRCTLFENSRGQLVS